MVASMINYPILLADADLQDLIDRQELRIDPFEPASINPTSIDLRLGTILVRYISPQTIKLNNPETIPETEEIDITGSTYTIHQGDFILGMTKEKVFIPNGYQGHIETKGNIARAGIQVHNGDGHVDPGFYGHITLEISNMHRKSDISIQVAPDIYICQLFISQLSSNCKTTYNGKYQGQTKPTAYHP